MNEEERRIHKERRKRQKRRRREWQKEKAKQERIADRCRRIQNRAEGLLEERIKSREIIRNTRTVDNVEATSENRSQKKHKEKNDQMAGPSGVAVCNASRRKRTETTQRRRRQKTVAPLEISPLNLMISTNLLGSGSYGCYYLTSYRGMEVVSKNFVVRAQRCKTHGQV